MAKLNDLFDVFISSINPDKEAVQYAIDAHEPIRECLEEQDDFKEYVEGSFLYGSYKRHTAVGDIKDVDIVVLTNFDIEDEKNTPRGVLGRLKKALARCYDDPENPQFQRRSIRIDDPLPENEEVEMTLDIIPAVVITDRDRPLRVPDRVVNEWIWSHPRGHLRNTSKLNTPEYSRKRFVPLVKIMKWWWQYQCEIRQPEVERPNPRGFWIECLTAEHFDRHQTAWADHFIAVLKSVSEKYAKAETVPELQDPGLDDETIETSMTIKEFDVFMEAVNDCLEKAVLARDASDPLTGSELWQELFGDKFRLYDAEETEDARSEAKSIQLSSYSHAQRPPWPLEFKKKYKVQLRAYIYRDRMKRSGLSNNGRVVRSGYYIKFVARTPAKGDYEVYWQVVNTGKHAERQGGLRGEFFSARFRGEVASTDSLINWEWTQYTGKHWIECFIVKDGVCLGRSGRFYVNIDNPNY